MADFRTEYPLHMRAVYLAARGILDDSQEAEDVVHETYVKLAGRLDSFRGTGTFRGWLCAVARRLALDKRRSERRLVAADSPESSGALEGPEMATIRAEEASRVKAAVESLPEAQRETLRLRYFAGLSLQEVAQARGVAIGTVKATLHQALEKLRRTIGGVPRHD